MSAAEEALATERLERLTHVIRKLAGWNGYDIADLIADGYLEEGDLDD